MNIKFDKLLSESDNVFTKMKILGICHHNRLEEFNFPISSQRNLTT